MMWNWRIFIPLDILYRLQLDGYPGWELVEEHPCFVQLQIVKGKNRSSYEIACEWDDMGKGQCYYRDWTQSGLPFVCDNEVYKSTFCFQFRDDAQRFQNYYGGEITNNERQDHP